MVIFENGSDMSGFRSLNNSTSKRVLNLLEPIKLTVWKFTSAACHWTRELVFTTSRVTKSVLLDR